MIASKRTRHGETDEGRCWNRPCSRTSAYQTAPTAPAPARERVGFLGIKRYLAVAWRQRHRLTDSLRQSLLKNRTLWSGEWSNPRRPPISLPAHPCIGLLAW